jgi:hypothetical protein
MGRRGDNLLGGLGRTASFAADLGRKDSFGRGRPQASGVYPRKGRGYGQIGEAAFPDLLRHYDMQQRWSSWRAGFALASSGLVGAAERFTAVQVTSQNPFNAAAGFQKTVTLMAGFSSPDSPEGRWLVTFKERGQFIAPGDLNGVTQRHVLLPDPEDPKGERLRLVLELKYPPERAAELASALSLVGELVEDTAVSATSLDADKTAGLGLLCMAVHIPTATLYFDASRYWTREYTKDGRLVSVAHTVGPYDPGPAFRPWMHLTQGLTMSCNCPAFIGAVFARLRAGEKLGGQMLFPQQGGEEEMPEIGTHVASSDEGVQRRFRSLGWARTPEDGCKHCHAVRWALGCPTKEPPDMLTLANEYWSSLKAMGQFEGMQPPMVQPRFIEQLRLNLLDERAFSDLDATLLATSVGDAYGVVPERMELTLQQQKPGTTGRFFIPVHERFHRQHHSEHPGEDPDAMVGDWWVGRGTSLERGIHQVLVYTRDGAARTEPALQPVTNPDHLPHVVP